LTDDEMRRTGCILVPVNFNFFRIVKKNDLKGLFLNILKYSHFLISNKKNEPLSETYLKWSTFFRHRFLTAEHCARTILVNCTGENAKTSFQIVLE